MKKINLILSQDEAEELLKDLPREAVLDIEKNEQSLVYFDVANEIEKVFFNEPFTVVIWKDGTTTMVKCRETDEYSKKTGLAMCVFKKVCGNQSCFEDIYENVLKN